MKKAFKKTVSLVLSFCMLMTMLFTMAFVVFAEEADTIVAAAASGYYDSNNFGKTITLEAGATYEFSLLYKKVAHEDCSFSVGSTTLIIGETAQNGATYDPATGLLTYTFTAESNETHLALNSCASWWRAETYIAAPTMRKLDESGKVIGIVDCDPAFLTWAKGWGADYTVASVDATLFGEKVETNIINYASANGDYDSNNFAKGIVLEAGETYRYTMLYKKVSGADCSFSIGSTTLISGEIAQNGAVYDAVTGLLTYEFIADGGEVYLSLNGCAGWGHAVTYIAAPKMEKVSDGSEIDCDPTFATWAKGWGTAYPTGLIDAYLFGHIHVYDNGCDASCNECDDIRAIEHAYDDKYDADCNVCGEVREVPSPIIAAAANGDYDSNNFGKMITLEAGAMYEFSILYKKVAHADCSFSIGSTVLIVGETAQNGATYDAATGLLTYTFTAEGGDVALALNSCAGWAHAETYIAAPTMRKLDEKGKVIGIVDCDPAFLTWAKGWGTAYPVSTIDNTVFGTTVETDIINYASANGDYDSNNFAKGVTLEAGETYAFSMLYKKVSHADCSFSIGSTTLISGEIAQNGAIYDAATGLLTYEFIADGGEVYLSLNGCAGWGHAVTYIAAPKMEKVSDGSEIDCDPTFATWAKGWGTAYPIGIVDGYLFGDRHPAPACDHAYDNDCDTDCNVCGETREVADHVYDNDCDATCNNCGETREVGEHVYDNACDTDCNVCGATREVGEHVYDDINDAECNECGFIRELPRMPGDIDGNRVVNNRDTIFLNRYINEWDDIVVVEENLDVNGDGTINNRDYMTLNRYINEWGVEIF